MNKEEAIEITGGLSRTTKMPCNSISLPAKNCHMGSKLVSLKGSVCEGCYALKGKYRFPNVKTALTKRLDKLYHPQWVEAMVLLIGKAKYFRWHDSGDIQSIMHLTNIMEVARLTPDCQHWLPTREYKMVEDYVESYGLIPKNMFVRLSAIMVDGNTPDKLVEFLSDFQNVEGFIGVSSVSKLHNESPDNCPAYSQGGKCGTCRKCWSNHYNITYPLH